MKWVSECVRIFAFAICAVCTQNAETYSFWIVYWNQFNLKVHWYTSIVCAYLVSRVERTAQADMLPPHHPTISFRISLQFSEAKYQMETVSIRIHRPPDGFESQCHCQSRSKHTQKRKRKMKWMLLRNSKRMVYYMRRSVSGLQSRRAGTRTRERYCIRRCNRSRQYLNEHICDQIVQHTLHVSAELLLCRVVVAIVACAEPYTYIRVYINRYLATWRGEK